MVTAVAFLIVHGLQSSAQFEVSFSGRTLGTASMIQKVTQTGGKELQLRMELTEQTNVVTVRQVSTWNVDGFPVRKFSEITTTSPKTRVTSSADFKGNRATTIVDRDGKREVKTLELAKGASLCARSEFWFLRDEPELNQTEKFWTLDLSRLDWDLNEATYKGEKKVTLNGKPVTAHVLQVSTGKRQIDSLHDDGGLPLLIEDQTGLKLSRVGLTIKK